VKQPENHHRRGKENKRGSRDVCDKECREGKGGRKTSEIPSRKKALQKALTFSTRKKGKSAPKRVV